MNLGAPDGGSIFDVFARQSKFFNHGFGIMENITLDVTDVEIIVGAVN